MKFLINMFLFVSISITAQTTLEKEIEKIKSNPNIKTEYIDDDLLKVNYDKFNSRTFYLGELESKKVTQDSIPRFVFNISEMDTSLFNYKYQFWQEVPLGNYYIKPIIGNISNNNRVEYYGHKKDFFTENSEVYCYEQDANGIFKQEYKYPSNTILAYNIFDINRDGNLELHLLDTTRYRIDSINWGILPDQSFFKKSSPNSLADSIFFKYNIYTYDNFNSQLNDFSIGDFDKDGINEAVYNNFGPRIIRIAKFNEANSTFDTIQAFQTPYVEDVAGFPIGDFDMDGKTDMVYAGGMGNIYLIECEGVDSYSMNWTGNTGVPNSYINFQTNDIDGNGKPEFWIGGESFVLEVTRLICYETNGNNSYHSVAEIEFPFLLSLNPPRANSIDVDNDNTEEIFMQIGNVVVFIKFTGSSNNHNYELYYYHLFDQSIQSAIPFKFPGDKYPSLILAMEYWQNGYGRAFTQMYKHYLTVDVDKQESVVNNYNLFECYPNPFNPSTKVKFSLASSANVQIVVYNSIGEEIITLLNQSLEGGEHNVVWNGVDKNNNSVPSGVYFITMLANPDIFEVTDRFQKTIKSVLIK
jgi:hypothetical protein